MARPSLGFQRRRVLLSVHTYLLTAIVQAQSHPDAPQDGDGEAQLELVVEADARELDASWTSASVTVVEVDAQLPATADVAAVVDSVSGVVVRRLGGLGDYSSVSIRGSSARQVQVFIDGIPLNPAGSSAINLSELPLQAFERVEVYRGNTPLEFGAAPVGGVVHLVTGDQRVLGASLGYGSFGTARLSATLAGGKRIGALHTGLVGFAEAFGTQGDFIYFSDNGTIYNRFDDARLTRGNNQARQLSSHLGLRLGERHPVSFSHTFLARDEGVPGQINSPAVESELVTFRHLATLRAEQQSRPLTATQRLWFHQRRETYDDRLGEVGTGNQWQRGDIRTLGLLAHLRAFPLPWLTPGLTGSLRRDTYVVDDLLNDRTSTDNVRTVGVLAVDAPVWVGDYAVRVNPLLQIDYANNRRLGTVPFADTEVAPDVEEQQLFASPRLGLLARPKRWLTLKANGGRFFRPPDFTELFGDRGGLIGNTNLRPEVGWQADLGVRVAGQAGSAKGTAEITAFISNIKDQIVFVQNSQRTSVPQNFGRAETRGLETSATFHLPWLDARFNATWVRALNLTETDELLGKRVPRIPTLELFEQVSVHHLGVRMGHQFSYTAANYWDAVNWLRAPPRPIHGAFARVSRGPASLELSILNILDQRVVVVDRNPLDDTDDARILQPLNDFFGFPLPGRAWMLTLRWAVGPQPEDPTS